MAGDGGRFWRHLAVAVIAFWPVAFPATGSAQDCTPAAQSSLPCDAVAVVDGQPVTLAQYEHWFAIAAKSGGQKVTPEPPEFTECIANKRESLPSGSTTTRQQLKRQCAAEHRALRDQVLQILISFLWIRGEAERQGVTVTQSEVRRQFREQKRASFPKHSDYERFLRQSGQTEQDILLRVELDALSNKIRERITSDVAVSDREVKRYYRRNRERFTVPERRDLRVVLTKTKAKAEAARARIEAGERWSTVAKDLSIDPASTSRGGKLRVTDGQQGRALNRAIFSAQRGELRGPVRSRFGWYVFEVTKIKPARRLTLAQARQTIVQLLSSQQQQQALDDFVRGFTRRWRARTICRSGYRTSDCANGPAPRTGW